MEENMDRKFKKMIKVYLLFAVVSVSSGCSQSVEDTSQLLVLGEEDTESVEEIQTENEVESETEEAVATSENNEAEAQENGMISVYICGAVQEAGVYELEEGSRIYQVIALAGGMTEDAMEIYLNQAEILEDGQKIYVPTEEEVETGTVSMMEDGLGSVETAGEASEDAGKVNINTASKEELMTITGIGESKAESIIEYRETYGEFEQLEDIQNITGIKEGTYSQLEDEITVN